jgi:hypothetical protein
MNKVAKCPLKRREDVYRFDGFEQLTIVIDGRLITGIRQQQADKREQELQVVRSGRQHERIDSERLAIIAEPHLDVGAVMLACDLPVAAAQIENERVRGVLLRVVNQ